MSALFLFLGKTIFHNNKIILKNKSKGGRIMIETVVSTGLPVDEKLVVQKNRLQPEQINGNEKRITIVTGIHGDELEGQYVCYELIKRIRENKKCLKGIVDVFPAFNPLGIDSLTRGIPVFDLDMNCIFPGNYEGGMMEQVAAQLIDDIIGSDLCIDLHSSNVFLMEIPQVRMSEKMVEQLLPLARLSNVDFIWIHDSVTVLESTLAHSLNYMGVPTLAIEMGTGMRITKAYGEQVLAGIFCLMKELGVWEGPISEVKEPIISTQREVNYINAAASGVFIPEVLHGSNVKKGACIGRIISALSGDVEEDIMAPCDGLIFTLREHPIVSTGSLITRILGE